MKLKWFKKKEKEYQHWKITIVVIDETFNSISMFRFQKPEEAIVEMKRVIKMWEGK